MQHWHLRWSHLVHPLPSAHSTLSRYQSHHITDDAGHQQTRLLMLAISRWLCVWVAAVRHLPSMLCNCLVALTAWVNQSTIARTNSRLTRAVQMGDNYLNDGHLPPERPRTDGQSATECRHAIHHTHITRASIPCHNGHIWHLAIACPSCRCPPDDHPHRWPPWQSAAWVVVRGGRWCGW